jgi:glycosyltransferase involved in cell wall biosynthesis
MRPADHIIVLDTGSTDNTVELLSSFGVEVHQKIYDHFRFDVARNDCLDLIPDEYNIRVSIDLDERFEQDNWADILKTN